MDPFCHEAFMIRLIKGFFPGFYTDLIFDIPTGVGKAENKFPTP